MSKSDLVTLLNHMDSQLGLAVYRGKGPHDPEWKAEARALIGRIRQMIRRLGDDPLVMPRELVEELIDEGECRFDHHGGCQEHGYLSLEQGEKCPQAELKELMGQTGPSYG